MKNLDDHALAAIAFAACEECLERISQDEEAKASALNVIYALLALGDLGAKPPKDPGSVVENLNAIIAEGSPPTPGGEERSDGK